MSYSQPARTAPNRIRPRGARIAGLLVVLAATAAFLGSGSPSPSPAVWGRPAAGPSATAPSAGARSRHERGGALGLAGGAVPDGTTVFDGGVPGVARLDPALLGALRSAAAEAEGDGIGFVVDSGWRSPAYQEHLLRQAIARYGSEAEAARWVATPDRSAHVSGDAVDIGPSGAAAWLSGHGAAYGLCRVYANEPWHFELRPQATAQGCPSVYADPTHDPRMQP